ncbi:tetratricopeptide repeat protein [Kamptonema sp. UHCC 0994]|uniref:J domain-containing protein n=1 Tax=Kamptonema sp. UHCC 0994 TaxID=3031329 RepID=UPI0023B9416F|nr:tetratricopeptide repeat protein [Kamptonema sp. UHCC 0994]MDF0552250.1 DnaJ domain-containing protein [Kamptonema sp. UHCC 0994]
MSFQITKGLFKFDFTDQHAILGVPLDAEFNDIRKRYMKIVRRLHSDTCPFENQAEKDKANEFLSKVVNPAYNKFSKESDRKEYGLLVDMIAKRTVKEQKTLQLESEAAKQLTTAKDFQEAYKKTLAELAEKQYESIEHSLDIIAQISEINMVYLLRKEQKGPIASQPQQASKATTTATSAPPPKAPAAPPAKSQDSFVEQACRRVEGLMSTKNYAKAILELKEALNRDPKHSKSHALLGMCYLEQKQATMAKIEINKALALNPQEPTALEAKKKLEQSTAQPATTAKGQKRGAKPQAKAGKAAADNKKTDKKVGKKTDPPKSEGFFGGFFGGLFGGSKKK